MSINLGLRRIISWNFCVADVPYAIIGADLINQYGLIIDLRHHRLTDPLTNLSSVAFIKPTSYQVLSTIIPTFQCSQLLSQFPEITGLDQATRTETDDVLHHIIMSGPPVAEIVRRLPPTKLPIAKSEFEKNGRLRNLQAFEDSLG